MKTLRVALKENPYPVYVGAGIVASLPALLAKHGFREKRAVLVTDSLLKNHHAKSVERELRRAGWSVKTFALPRGERAKDFSSLLRLYDFLLRNKCERATPLIAIGGGAVGDAAGFAAATFFRGLPLIHVPTTLLAQVDSAVGGKTAVNLPRAKNAVGAFYQPRLVLCDVSLLRTLPRRDVVSGLGEAVKYALVFDRALFAWFEKNLSRVLRKESRALEYVVEKSVAWKARVVTQDERDEKGVRELLNFGHTVGHALEAATDFKYFRHGEAVIRGMRAALSLSKNRGLLAPKEYSRAAALLTRLPAPAVPRRVRFANIVRHLRYDKKVRASKNVFVLLRGVGRPVRTGGVSRGELRRAVGEGGVIK